MVYKSKQTTERKLPKLSLSPVTLGLNAENMIFNFSNRDLIAAEKRIQLLGLDFGLPLRKLNFNQYYLIFEKLSLQVQNFTIYECIPNAHHTFIFLKQLHTQVFS